MCKPEGEPLLETESAGTSILDFPASKTVRNKRLLFHHLVYGILLRQSKVTKTVVTFYLSH